MPSIVLDLNNGLGTLKSYYEKAIIGGMRKALLVLMEELKRLTPEDTKEMVNAYRLEGITRQGTQIVGTISNDSDHAIYVEYGVNGLEYNYHKPKGSVAYTGEGNRTFARAIDNKRDDILQIIADSIG